MIRAERVQNFNDTFFGLIREIHGNPASSQSLALVVDGILIVGTLGLPPHEQGQKQPPTSQYYSDVLSLKDVRLYVAGGVATAESIMVRVASVSAFATVELFPPTLA